MLVREIKYYLRILLVSNRRLREDLGPHAKEPQTPTSLTQESYGWKAETDFFVAHKP